MCPENYRHVKIFRSSNKQMMLRLNSEEKKKCVNAEPKQCSPLHEGVLVGLPVEKFSERKLAKS